MRYLSREFVAREERCRPGRLQTRSIGYLPLKAKAESPDLFSGQICYEFFLAVGCSGEMCKPINSQHFGGSPILEVKKEDWESEGKRLNMEDGVCPDLLCTVLSPTSLQVIPKQV